MKALKDFLNKKPQRMEKYVSGGLLLAHVLAFPVRKTLEHLLTIQDIPLSTKPGERFTNILVQAFNQKKLDDHGYDTDFDFSWAHKKLMEYRAIHPTMNEKAFRRLTDISNLSDREVALQRTVDAVVPPDNTKSDFLKFVEEMKEIDDEKEIVSKSLDELTKFSKDFEAGSIREALVAVRKALADLPYNAKDIDKEVEAYKRPVPVGTLFKRVKEDK